MLDDFRRQAGDSLLDGEEENATGFHKPEAQRRFLGMTPFQTFIIAFLLLVITCLVSASCLLVTGRVVLPML
jgi:hypothetical protein